MALILVPGLLLEGVELSAAGLFFGWAAGVMYAVYLLFAKSLRGLDVRSTAVVFTQSAFTAAVMLVPGLLAVAPAHYHVQRASTCSWRRCSAWSPRPSASACSWTACATSACSTPRIIAYVEPVSAPLYALVFLGQVPSRWTIAGGALIVAAGILVVLYGRGEELEPELVG